MTRKPYCSAKPRPSPASRRTSRFLSSMLEDHTGRHARDYPSAAGRCSMSAEDAAAAVAGLQPGGRQLRGRQRRRRIVGDRHRTAAPAIQSSRAAAISSCDRPTKFHHITSGSSNGAPPSSSSRLPGPAAQGQLARGRRPGTAAPPARTPPRPPPRNRTSPAAAYSKSRPQRQRGRRRDRAAPAARRPAGCAPPPGSARPANSPTSRVTSRSPSRQRGRSAWWAKSAAPARAGSGSATHNCTPCITGGCVGRRPLRVGDAVAGGHHVQLARPDRLHVAEAVPVQDLAVEQPGHRLQAGVRVRRHLHAGPLRHVVRAEVVHETPGADHPARPLRQQPPHRGVAAQRHVVAGQQHTAGIGVGHARWPGLRRHRFGTLHRPTVRAGPSTVTVFAPATAMLTPSPRRTRGSCGSCSFFGCGWGLGATVPGFGRSGLIPAPGTVAPSPDLLAVRPTVTVLRGTRKRRWPAPRVCGVPASGVALAVMWVSCSSTGRPGRRPAAPTGRRRPGRPTPAPSARRRSAACPATRRPA